MASEVRTPFILTVDKDDKENLERNKADVARTKKAMTYKVLKGEDPKRFLSVANLEYASYIEQGYSEADSLGCATRIAQARV